MRVRVFILLFFTAILLPPWSLCRGNEVQSTALAPVVPETVDPLAESTTFSFGQYTISADTVSGDLQGLRHLAKGHVVMKTPMLDKYDQPMQITFNAASLLIAAGQKSGTDTGVESQPTGYLMSIDDAILTTCERPLHHRHYELTAKTLTVYPGLQFEARHVSIRYAGHRLMTLSRLRGDFSSEGEGIPRPSLIVGRNSTDGVYAGAKMLVGIGSKDTLSLNARLGSERILRGDIAVSRPVTLLPKVGGSLSLLTTYRDDVPNRLVDNEQLYLSRLPALLWNSDEIPMSRSSAHPYKLRFGAGIGRYREEPTDVTRMRTQLWGVASSPRFPVAGLEAFGSFGAQVVANGSRLHRYYIGQVSVETPAQSEIYGNLSFIRRGERGRSPFLFDQVDIRNELFAEVEFPLGKQSAWSIDLANRHDLDRGKSRNLIGTLIYRDDCFSYGLAYDSATRGLKLGFEINGLGSFRKSGSAVYFIQ